MKPLFILMFMFVILPISITPANHTLGQDIPENELLTDNEVALYKQHLNEPHECTSNSEGTWHLDVTPKGLYVHVYPKYKLTEKVFTELCNKSIKNTMADIPFSQAAVDTKNRCVIFYRNPTMIRAELLALSK